jgi:hypothetical protein
MNQSSNFKFRLFPLIQLPDKTQIISKTVLMFLPPPHPQPQGRSTLQEFSDAKKVTAELNLISSDR